MGEIAKSSKVRTRIVVFAPEPLGERITGPSIRALAIARLLAEEFDTTLAITENSDVCANEKFSTYVWSRSSASFKWLSAYDVAIAQSVQFPARVLLSRQHGKPFFVFDLYNPVLFENLAGDPEGKISNGEFHALRRLTAFAIRRADFLLCATPRQRDLWLGALYVLGRLRPGQEQGATGPDELLQVAPFGHCGGVLEKKQAVLKGVRKGIESNDRVILWNGGVWNWFDPLTLIQAMKELVSVHRDLKLVFMGVRSPNENFNQYQMLERARALAADLGLLDRHVFFYDTWVPFDERVGYLLEADLIVCTSSSGAENDFSCRTRLIDAVWAGVPVVCTRGGFMADFLELHRIGLTVTAHDVHDLVKKLEFALEEKQNRAMRENIADCRDILRWEKCLEPLVSFCRKVQHGQYRRASEPPFRSHVQYLAYKIPSWFGSFFKSSAGPK